MTFDETRSTMANDIPNAKQRILDRCDPLFVAHGFKHLSMDQIAHELHVSKRTIYQYFGSKAGLIEQACRAAAERDNAELTRIIETPIDPIAKMRDLVRYLIACPITSAHAEELATHYNAGFKEHLRLYRQRKDAVERVYVEGVQAGLFIDSCPSIPGVPDIVTAEGVAQVVAFLCSAVVRYEPLEFAPYRNIPEEVVEHAVHMISRAFLKPGAVLPQSS